MNWLREAVSDDDGVVSVKRVALLLISFALTFALITLSIAALLGQDVSTGIAATATAGGLSAGGSYVGGKFMEK